MDANLQYETIAKLRMNPMEAQNYFIMESMDYRLIIKTKKYTLNK